MISNRILNHMKPCLFHIKRGLSNNTVQLKYDIGIIRNKINSRLIETKNGHGRDGILFEKVLKIIYQNEGYNTIHTGGTGDGGVDLIVHKDNKKIAIQAKNYNDKTTVKYLTKPAVEMLFNKIKTEGEIKHLCSGESFHSARIHIYNDNIVNMRPEFMEQIAIKHGYDIFDKGVYGKTWLLNYTNYLTRDSIADFYELFEI